MAKYQPKTYFIQTYGCQANIADSNKIRAILDVLGYEEVNRVEDCNVYIINTCSVRQKSDDKAYGLGKKIKKLRDLGKDITVVMAGCVVGSALGERKRYELSELKHHTSWVDIYISSLEINKLPDLLGYRGIDIDNIVPKVGDTHAYVNISNGCDNFCTYCVVPYARGREVHRSKDEILAEIRALVELGVSSVTLCGQNVNSWGLSGENRKNVRIGSSGVGQKLPFTSLLGEIHRVSGIEHIEFISSNPFDFTQDLVDIFKLPKISNYLHIAAQSGNNDILRMMNRNHTVEEFMDLINRLREVRPDLEIGTDVIVGFCGESREQFLDTVKLFRSVKFAVAFISMYSPRKGTVAYNKYEDNVSLDEKKYRHSYLTRVWKETKNER